MTAKYCFASSQWRSHRSFHFCQISHDLLQFLSSSLLLIIFNLLFGQSLLLVYLSCLVTSRACPLATSLRRAWFLSLLTVMVKLLLVWWNSRNKDDTGQSSFVGKLSPSFTWNNKTTKYLCFVDNQHTIIQGGTKKFTTFTNKNLRHFVFRNYLSVRSQT